VGGQFLNVGGQARNSLAALDAATGLATAWNPNANYEVYALAVGVGTVYVGGYFTSIGGQTRIKIAALSAATGLSTPWNPNANSDVYVLAVNGSTVYVGGHFSSIGGEAQSGIAAITTGVVDVPDVFAARPGHLFSAPNPVLERTVFHFALARASYATLDLYDTAGRRVRRLYAGMYGAGASAVGWDGRDDGGRRVSAGMYLLRLEVAGQPSERHKVVMLE
jgi:hypothetical protein